MAKSKTKIVFGGLGASHVNTKHVVKGKAKKSSRKRMAGKC